MRIKKNNFSIILSIFSACIGGLSVHFVYKYKNKYNSYFNGSNKSYETVQNKRNKSNHGTLESQKMLDKEQYSRIMSFFGEENFKLISNSFIIIIGLGGVGSHAAHMLLRSGIKKLRIIDFDNVSLSSLNRHAVATRKDVGLSKVYATKNHFLDISPNCEIETIPYMFNKESAEELLEGNPDFVLDCIDDVHTKVDLLEICMKKNLKIITSSGAGAKLDPSRLHIGTLSDATRDPLANKIRYYLRKKKIDPKDIIAVYSSEKSVCELLPLNNKQTAAPHEYGSLENFRIRVLPVLGTMPATFGQAMAAYVLAYLGKMPLRPEAVPGLSKEQRNKLYQKLQMREFQKYKEPKEIPLDKMEVDFICKEIWKMRSAVSDARMGGSDAMLLSRWRLEKPLTPGNIILITKKEMEKLNGSNNDISIFGKDVIKRIDARLASYGEW